jgi:glutamyl-tRNA reductase
LTSEFPNVDPEVGTIENVHVIDMDDLDKVVIDHKARRESEILQAENIIQKEWIPLYTGSTA